jgi:hypothetical protein
VGPVRASDDARVKLHRALLALALAPALAGCGGGSATTRSVTEAHAQLPELPGQFLAVKRGAQTVLVDLKGHVLAHVDGWTPGTRLDQPQLYRGSRARTIDRAARRLVPFVPDLPAVRGGCTPVGMVGDSQLVQCSAQGDPSLALRRPDGTSTPLVPPASTHGLWVGAFASPDGKRLLLQWSDECETPFALVAPAAGGRARLVAGGKIGSGAPESYALGWTRDGRALIELPQGACGGGTAPPGVYAFAADGSRRLIARGFPAAFFGAE